MQNATLQGVRWITFDAAGTLIFPYPSVGDVYGQILAEQGIAAPTPELNERFLESFRELTSKPRARTDDAAERAFWKAIVQATVSPWCPPEKLDAVFAEAFDAFASARCWRLHEGAEDLLASLKQRGYKLALLSNSDKRFRRVFSELGISSYFSYIFLSGELGYEKPDPRLFDRVLQTLGVSPEEVLHVGDNARLDGEGARQAGWNAAILGQEISSLTDLNFLLA